VALQQHELLGSATNTYNGRLLMKDPWLIWQLADSAFPAGGFAHSGGLEAAWRWGKVPSERELTNYIRANLTQVAHSQLPFVVRVHGSLERFCESDRLCEAFLSNHVANRASRRQGQSLLTSSSAIFATRFLVDLRALTVEKDLACHFSPVFGAVTGSLEVNDDVAARLFLFVHLRGLVSASVRLGLIGPFRGQAIQHQLGEFVEGVVRCHDKYCLEDIAQTAPLIDILQANHDRLYSRLFQS
jgi:urease accessory protein